MYEKWIGTRIDVFRTRLFIASIFIPLLLSILITVGIKFSPEFQSFLSGIWKDMKLPIAIASLSLPLATWVIANHSSSRATISLNLQYEKRLVDSYFEQEKHFEKTLGRFLDVSEFRFIEKDDVPIIISKMYEFNRLKEKGHLSINEDIYVLIKQHYESFKSAAYDFYVEFNDADENNLQLLNGMVLHFISVTINNLNYLSSHLGTRTLNAEKDTLDLIFSSYGEIYQFLFEIIPQEKHRDVFTSFDKEDIEVFNAIMNTVSKKLKIKINSISSSSIIESIRIKDSIEFAIASPLKREVCNIIESVARMLIMISPDLKGFVLDGDYKSYKFFFDQDVESCINIFFKPKNDTDSDDEALEGKVFIELDDHKLELPVQKNGDNLSIFKDKKKRMALLSDLRPMAKYLECKSFI